MVLRARSVTTPVLPVTWSQSVHYPVLSMLMPLSAIQREARFGTVTGDELLHRELVIWP
jgi:hypothetical protein